MGDRKQDSVRERNVDGETTDRYRDVGDDRRVLEMTVGWFK